MARLPPRRGLAALLCLLAGRSAAVLVFDYPTGPCTTTEWVRGKTTFCSCTGGCLDGSTPFNAWSLCKYKAQPCEDALAPLRCAPHQVMSPVYDATSTIDAGIGFCTETGCPWVHPAYAARCCDCPPGFLAVAPDCAGWSGVASGMCAGCTEPDERIVLVDGAFACQQGSVVGLETTVVAPSGSATGSATDSAPATTASATSGASSSSTSTSSSSLATESSSTTEVSVSTESPAPPQSTAPSLLCKTAQAASTVTSSMGLLVTWAGSMCAITDVRSLALTLLQSIDAVASAVANPSSGVLGTEFSAASAVVASLHALLLGAALVAGAPAEASLAVALPLAYVAACNLLTNAGAGLFVADALADGLAELSCPSPPPSKRSVSPGALARRDGAYNPCAELVAAFPAGSASAIATDDACNELASYEAASIEDEGIASAVSTLQAVCASLGDSHELGLARDLASVLNAVQEFIPYCAVEAPSSGVASSSSTAESSAAAASSPPPQSTASRTGSCHARRRKRH
ncbi:hypothetical protein VTJ83DRAFT_6864 [Remersonia thermophila]|uniref:Uncharacterized protein n=1 Tax=Remersonia thermophila TaxID=72144 RepID=A0ABR4D5X2_9PEZI